MKIEAECKKVAIEVNSQALGKALAETDSEEQAKFFIQFATETSTMTKHNWEKQCAYICSSLTQDQMMQVVFEMKILVEMFQYMAETES